MTAKQHSIDISAAGDQLARLVALAAAGDDVIITREGETVARLVAAAPRKRRVPGRLKGKISLDDSFFDPLPEEELAAWEGR